MRVGTTRTLPADAAREAEVVAKKLTVSPALHSEDNILWFLLAHPLFKESRQAVTHYFENGLMSAARVRELADRHLHRSLLQRLMRRQISILDFASGYGCVTRHLPVLFPKAHIAASDIHPAAVDFIRDKIGTKAILSSHVPEQFSPEQTFDLIFALSFFSHISDVTWGRWLHALFTTLNPGGLLIFTTHGIKSFPCFPPDAKLDERGYYFLGHSEQDDLDGAEYGSAITSRDYVFRQIAVCRGARLLEYEEGVWYGRQDFYVVAKHR
jgi:SAM-dependent methyltransferase